ncbi:hypothetical protein [Rhodococcus sp. UNC363MFTsu5.1]|uniref:hypothetical protein n=1 Tax=Rhodococcus sp. UNC363MFTsu5.1 TaxID=1449069 RepID=UPI0004892038|nr:hypothetical protein [Rhodococcus sp. UNC363MFTsu5.1]
MRETVTDLRSVDHMAVVNPAETGWSNQLEWEERLVPRQPTLRATLECCGAEPGHEAASLRMTSALFLSRMVRGLPPGAGLHGALDHRPIADRVTALCIDSVLAGYEGDVATAEALVDEAGHAAARLDDGTLLAAVAEATGYLAVFDGDLHSAGYCFEDSLTSFRACGTVPPISTLVGSALVHGLLGDEQRSTSRREEALAIAEASETACRARA